MNPEEIRTSDKPVYLGLDTSKEVLLALFERYKTTGRTDILAFAYHDVLAERVGVLKNGVKTLITDPITRKIVASKCLDALGKKWVRLKGINELNGDNDQAGLIGELLSRLDSEGEFHRRVKEKFLTIYFDTLIAKEETLKL